MRILTCNILFSCDLRSVGKNNWENRCQVCVEAIRKTESDIISCQEVTWEQFSYLQEKLTPERYGAFWVEACSYFRQPQNAIFYDRRKFQVCNHGSYWLSETPHVAGSKSWGSDVRLVNYMVLRGAPGEFRVINTHLHYGIQLAREKSAELIVQDTAAWDKDMPQILTGDMNCNHLNPVLQRFFATGWRDSYAEATGTIAPGFTGHCFEGDDFKDPNKSGKLDWILVRGKCRATDANIIKDHEEDIYPSDHYFVTADIELL